VLPIRYCFSDEGPKLPSEERDSGDPAPFDRDLWEYQRTDPKNLDDIWKRSAYFTIDTSYALFQRTHWFELKKKSGELGSWASFHYYAPPLKEGQGQDSSPRKITVHISPPTVVLFEAENAWMPKKSDEPLFQIGFLILDCTLHGEMKEGVKEGNAHEVLQLGLEDLMEFNERARCLWNPWKTYQSDYMRIMGNCPHLWPAGKAPASVVAWQRSILTPKQMLAPEHDQDAQEAFEKLAAEGGDQCAEIRSFVGLWSAALGYPISGGSKRRWLTDFAMRESARTWTSSCSVAANGAASVSNDATPIPTTARESETHTGWLAGTDYRAFVWTSAYICDSPSRGYSGPPDRPEMYGHWVKFLNVDSIGKYWSDPDNVESDARATSTFEQGWARPRTYLRWAHYGTYYGVSPHSGAMLTNYSDPEPQYDRHFRTLYFDQMLLLLYLRTVAFQLSIRLAYLGAEFKDHMAKAHRNKDKGDEIRKYRGQFRDIRQFFMSFATLYQFPLLSTQQQGVELYTMFRHFMDVDDLFRDVSDEIDAWDRVMAQHNEETVNSRVSFIAYIGLPVAMTTLLLTGMPILLDVPVGSRRLRDVYFSFVSSLPWVGKWNEVHLVLGVLVWLALFVILGGIFSMAIRNWVDSEEDE
jgi:hypothetical protein